MGRPVSPTITKGRHYRVVPRRRADGSYGYNANVYNAATRKRENVGTFDTPEEGTAACQQRLGVLSSGPAITVAPVDARWLESKRTAVHERSSSAYAESATGAFVDTYGTEPANAITKAVAEEWV